jgi:hypothetical protein
MARLSGPRRAALAQLAAHGDAEERAVCTRSLGQKLAAEGLVTRERVNPGRPAVLRITDAGRAALNPQIDACACRACRPRTL